MEYYGAIEAGGTKFVCSVAADPDHLFFRKSVSHDYFPKSEPCKCSFLFFQKNNNKNTTYPRLE
jgi:fructokinase